MLAVGETGPAARRWLWLAAEVGLYLTVAIVAVAGAWGKAVGRGVDLPGTLWYHEWIAHCLREGISPGWTPWFFHPTGKDIFSHTGNNFVDILLAMPFFFLLGSPAHMMPYTVVLLLGNALSMRALLRALGLSRAAVLAGSLIFAVHPYMINEIDGARFTQALLWFWPLALRELVLMVDDRRWRRPVLAGLLVALQAWTYWFCGHMFLVVLLPAVLLLSRRAWRDRGYWLRMAVAGAVCLAVVAPGLATMGRLWAAGEIPGLRGDLEEFDILREISDELSFWVLDPRLSMFQPPAEGLVLALVGLVFCRRRAAWGLASVLALLLVAGPDLPFPGGWTLPNPVWWGARAVLPGMSRLLFPYRFWAPLALVSTVAVAEALDLHLRHRVARAVALAPIVYLGAAQYHLPVAAMVQHTKPRRPAYIDAVRRAPGVVLDLPFTCADEAIGLQPLHGQPLVGGMGERVAPLRPRDLVNRVYDEPLLADVADAARGVHQQGKPLDRPLSDRSWIRWVVLHKWLMRDSELVQACWLGPPGVDQVRVAMQRLGALLGPPSADDLDAAAWDLRRLAPGPPPDE